MDKNEKETETEKICNQDNKEPRLCKETSEAIRKRNK